MILFYYIRVIYIKVNNEMIYESLNEHFELMLSHSALSSTTVVTLLSHEPRSWLTVTISFKAMIWLETRDYGEKAQIDV